ncbi:hypothetical protein NDU88_006957 [Pleurodeles waltl]|uniref:Uncharacterized protein n=1 Tax=Pleurodeles waltl TaxID=8319 RepID=A0AAV7VNB9_PLEWA|nr:hypothetical protein NDU88_006957 [Pleurodeles waltl]
MGTRSPRGWHSEVALTTTDDGAKADWPAGGQRPWIPQEEAANEETATEKTAKEETAKEEAANEAEGAEGTAGAPSPRGGWAHGLLVASSAPHEPTDPVRRPTSQRTSTAHHPVEEKIFNGKPDTCEELQAIGWCSPDED